MKNTKTNQTEILNYVSKLRKNGICFTEIANFLPNFYTDIEILDCSKNHIHIKTSSKHNILIDNKAF